MKITLDENYYACTDIKTLGYVGEVTSRKIIIENYQCKEAESYKIKFEYPDGKSSYEVDITNGEYIIEPSILRRVGDVYVQILAGHYVNGKYDYLKKSNILKLHINRSLNGNPVPVPTYEKSVEALEKMLAAEKSSAENASKAESASNAAQAAQNAAEQAKQTTVKLAANAEKAAENAAQSEKTAQSAAAAVADKAEQIQKNTDDISKLYSKSDGIVCNAEGKAIVLNDSSDLGLSGLRIFGRSEQKTTTGAQLLNIVDCNIPEQIGKITLQKNSDGSIKLIGNHAASSDGMVFTHFLGEYIDMLEDGKTYSASGFCKLQVVENGVNRYWTKVTVNKSTMTNIKPYLQVSEKDYLNGMTIYPMLNEGNTVIAWEPYTGGIPSPNPDYPQEIVSMGDSGKIETEVFGGNLLDISKTKSETKTYATGEQVRLINNGDGTLTVKGTTPESNYYVSSQLANVFTLPNGNYVCSCNKIENGIQIIFRLFYSDGTYKNAILTHDATKQVFAADEDVTKIVFFTQVKPGFNVDTTFRVMLNRGAEALLWEPYKHQTLAVPTPNGLPGIPVDSSGNYTDGNGQQWVCDEIDFERGVYVQRVALEKATRNIKLTETPDVPGRYRQSPFFTHRFKKGAEKAMSNCLSWAAWGRPSNEKDIFCVHTDSVYYSPKDEMTVGQVNEKINALINSDEGLWVLGQLETPVETSIPTEQVSAYKALHTNKPTTTITNSDNAHMAVRYTADTKTYIDNKFAELQAAIISTGGNV